MRRFALFAFGLALASCNRTPPGPELVPVGGTVLYKGKALDHAHVIFQPGEGTAGAGAWGSTDEEGKYKLTYNRGNAPGTVAGQYKVVVSKRVFPDGKPVPPDYNVPTFDSDARETLPHEYSDFQFSKLTARVP